MEEKVKRFTFSNIQGLAHRWLRRKYYRAFRPGYIKESIAKRKGRCNNCGCCILRIPKCKHFQAPNICLLWREKGWDALPQDCKNCPFDEKDKNPKFRDRCGFYWESKKEKK